MTLTVTGIETIEVEDPQGLCNTISVPGLTPMPVAAQGPPPQKWPTIPAVPPMLPTPISPVRVPWSKWVHRDYSDLPTDKGEKWTRGLRAARAATAGDGMARQLSAGEEQDLAQGQDTDGKVYG